MVSGEAHTGNTVLPGKGILLIIFPCSVYPGRMAQLKLRGIRKLEFGRWCKCGQMRRDVYLLRAARISLNILVICVVPLLMGGDKYCIDLNIIADVGSWCGEQRN